MGMKRSIRTLAEFTRQIQTGEIKPDDEGRVLDEAGALVSVRQFVPGAVRAAGPKDRFNEDGTLTLRISTPEVDRYDTTFEPRGWKLENYSKNPVVLWAHNKREDLPPLARSERIGPKEDGLYSDARFVAAEVWEFAERIRCMYRDGFLNAASIAFDPEKYSIRKDGSGIVDFQVQDLLEYSLLPVPGCPGALVAARDAGHDVRGIASVIEWELDAATSLCAPRDVLEAAAMELKPRQVQVPAKYLRCVEPVEGHRGFDGEGALRWASSSLLFCADVCANYVAAAAQTSLSSIIWAAGNAVVDAERAAVLLHAMDRTDDANTMQAAADVCRSTAIAAGKGDGTGAAVCRASCLEAAGLAMKLLLELFPETNYERAVKPEVSDDPSESICTAIRAGLRDATHRGNADE